MSESLGDNIHERLKQVLAVPIPEDILFADFDESIAEVREAFRDLATQFRHNVLATCRTVAVPFLMASRFRMIETMNTFRGLYPTEAQAAEAWNAWVAAPGVAEAGSDAIVRTLLDHHQLDPELAEHSGELLRQGAALLYAAFEALLRDGYERWTGTAPKTWEMMCALTGSKDSKEAFDQFGIGQLHQDRHVIVHRCGLVDEEYVRRTGSALAPGDRIVITPQALHDHFFTVVNCGRSLLELFSDPYEPAAAPASGAQ